VRPPGCSTAWCAISAAITAEGLLGYGSSAGHSTDMQSGWQHPVAWREVQQQWCWLLQQQDLQTLAGELGGIMLCYVCEMLCLGATYIPCLLACMHACA